MVTPDINAQRLRDVVASLPETWTPPDSSKPLLHYELGRLVAIVDQGERLEMLPPQQRWTILLACVYSRGLLAGYNYALAEETHG